VPRQRAQVYCYNLSKLLIPFYGAAAGSFLVLAILIVVRGWAYRSLF
jgi:hypothetical protein